MAERAVGGERRAQGRYIARLVFRAVHDTQVASQPLAYSGDALAIGAVYRHQHFTVRGNEGGYHRLDYEGAAAL